MIKREYWKSHKSKQMTYYYLYKDEWLCLSHLSKLPECRVAYVTLKNNMAKYFQGKLDQNLTVDDMFIPNKPRMKPKDQKSPDIDLIDVLSLLKPGSLAHTVR
jgi:hypothetical protein